MDRRNDLETRDIRPNFRKQRISNPERLPAAGVNLPSTDDVGAQRTVSTYPDDGKGPMFVPVHKRGPRYHGIDPEQRFGGSSKVDTHGVRECVNFSSGHMEDMIHSVNEGVYHGTKRQVGRKMLQPGLVPDHVQDAVFGVATDPANDRAQNLIPQPECNPELERTLSQERSQRKYGCHPDLLEPGTQKTMKYEWPQEVSTESRFGLIQPKDPKDTVDYTFKHYRELSSVPPVVNKKQVLVRERKLAPLGQTRKCLSAPMGTMEMRHGVASSKDSEGVKDLIRSNVEISTPSGKSSVIGKRVSSRMDPEVIPEQPAGLPSIRGDIPIPAVKSVTDHKNYGDELGTIEIQNTFGYSHGVGEQDMTSLRTKENMREVCEGLYDSEEEFEEVWNIACETLRHHVNPAILQGQEMSTLRVFNDVLAKYKSEKIMAAHGF